MLVLVLVLVLLLLLVFHSLLKSVLMNYSLVSMTIPCVFRDAPLPRTSSTIEGRRGCNIFVPVLGGNGTKIAPTGDIFDQPPGQMR